MTSTKSISEFFACAERQPDAVALSESNGTQVTYGRLAQEIKSLTIHLREKGVADGSRVALLQQKNVRSVICLLATLNAGGTVIPIDSELPDTRINYILRDLSPHYIIAEEALVPADLKSEENITVTVASEQIVLLHVHKQQNKQPERYAYILYTSGSTGEPKGVCISHNALNAFTDWSKRHFPLASHDKLASVAPFHFDLSLLDIFLSLSSGASLHIFSGAETRNPRMMSEMLSRRAITLLYATPSFYIALVQFGKMEKWNWNCLERILFAGEIFPIRHLHALMNQFEHARFFNLFGPTETNVCAWYEIKKIEADRQVPYPIGTVCEHLEHEIGDDGELLIGGDQVAKGYWNRPSLTEEKFFQREGATWFHTGDLVKKDSSGLLLYCGRKDRMIKRRGYRIEPAEIEQALLLLPYVLEAAIIETRNSEEEIMLVAILHNSEPTNLPLVKQYLLKWIPEYMLPDRVIQVGQFPKTSTGKTDYEKLKLQI